MLVETPLFLQCKRQCPVVRMGKLCIEVEPTSKVAFLSEELCIGCGICVKKCPFEAIQIINLPKNLERSTTHRYAAEQAVLAPSLPASAHPLNPTAPPACPMQFCIAWPTRVPGVWC